MSFFLVALASVFMWAAPARAALPVEDPRWFDNRAIGGHAIRLLPDGRTLTEARLQLLRGARDTIYLSAFGFKADGAAMAVAGILCDKAREGLDVRLLLDHRGSSPLEAKSGWLRSCGARVLFYDPLDFGAVYFRQTMHEKLLIVDGRSVILGGSGYSDTYLNASFDSPAWHDLDARIDGPAACWYHYRFERNWRQTAEAEIQGDRQAYADAQGQGVLERLYGLERFRPCQYVPAGQARVYPLQQNPLFEGGRWLLKTHIAAIRASHRTIRLYSPYFTPDDELIAALLDARARGVEVTVLTNSAVSCDEAVIPPVMFEKTARLMQAGVQVRIWGKASMLHRKGGVYDGRWAYLGSDNLDRGAHVYNSEDIAFTDDADTVHAIEAELDADLAASAPMDRATFLSGVRGLSLRQRLMIRLFSRYF